MISDIAAGSYTTLTLLAQRVLLAHTLAEGLVVDDIIKQDRATALFWNLIYLMNLLIASTVNLKFNPWNLTSCN